MTSAKTAIFQQAHDYAMEYWQTIDNRPVFPTPATIDALRIFDTPLPKDGENAHDTLQKLHQFGSPATVAQIGGRYFGFVNGGALPLALATRWLTDCWDQNAALAAMSPIASTLEKVCERWLVSLFNLPQQTIAGFVSGSSIAILVAIASARHKIFKRLGWDINKKGIYNAPPLRIITGHEAHASVIRAISLLGLGTDCIERVDTDAQGRIIAKAMPALDEKSIIILQAGNVCSGAFDPFAEICHDAREKGAWVHIDGAFGLWAAASQKLAYLCDGMEKAHSWSFDAHKTLNATYDSGVVLCEDSEALLAALETTGSYLLRGEERDGMMYTPEMSRRARAVELWSIINNLGKNGIDCLVQKLHDTAKNLAHKLQQNGLPPLNDVVFNQILIAAENDDMTQKMIRLIQDSGECWMGNAIWHGKQVIRISVCSVATSDDDILRTQNAILRARDNARQL